MIGRDNDFHFWAGLTLFALSLFIALTSAQYIQCTHPSADEFLDFQAIQKARDQQLFQNIDVMVVYTFDLATIQLVERESLALHYHEAVIAREVSTTVLRC